MFGFNLAGHAFFVCRKSCGVYRVENHKIKSKNQAVFLTKSMTASPYNNCEKGDAMYYEVYVDSIFLMNLVMNFYLLLLVNHSTFHTATCKRLLFGAVVGAVFAILPFFIGGLVWLKLVIGVVVGTIGMIFTAFPIKSVRAMFGILEKLLLYSFLMGGTLLFLISCVPFIRRWITGLFGIMGAGALICMALLFCKERELKKKQDSLCRATLIQKDERMTVEALVDSGNSLIEPISGKPVCIIERDVFNSLWKEEEALYRAVPYHSIGRKRGVLQGYLLSELQIELEGMVKSFRDVYVAVCEERISEGVKMIVNPMLFQKC